MPDDDKARPVAGAASGSASDATAASGPDIAMLGGPTEHGVQILRMREGQVELGELRNAPEGKPILGESIRLHARDDHPGVYDVETLARGPLARRPQNAAQASPQASPPVRKGPAKVATEAYRSGWDSIFKGSGSGHAGGSKPGGDLPN